jgi:hypothetical protein
VAGKCWDSDLGITRTDNGVTYTDGGQSDSNLPYEYTELCLDPRDRRAVRQGTVSQCPEGKGTAACSGKGYWMEIEGTCTPKDLVFEYNKYGDKVPRNCGPPVGHPVAKGEGGCWG